MSDLGIDIESLIKKIFIFMFQRELLLKMDRSAGITMALAVALHLSSIPIKSDIAMTGEITLRGEVLEIGGLKGEITGSTKIWNQGSYHTER